MCSDCAKQICLLPPFWKTQSGCRVQPVFVPFADCLCTAGRWQQWSDSIPMSSAVWHVPSALSGSPADATRIRLPARQPNVPWDRAAGSSQRRCSDAVWARSATDSTEAAETRRTEMSSGRAALRLDPELPESEFVSRRVGFGHRSAVARKCSESPGRRYRRVGACRSRVGPADSGRTARRGNRLCPFV